MEQFFYENKSQLVEIRRGTNLECGAHLHTHLELVCMLEGTARAIVDSREHRAAAGETLLVFPNQVHQYARLGEEQYLIAIFHPELCPEYQPVFSGKLPAEPVVRERRANQAVRALMQRLLKLSLREGPYVRAQVKGYFLVLLGELLAHMELADSRPADSDTVKAVLRYCQENYSREITLQSVSDALHLNKYYLSHLFRQKLQMGFCEYIAALRVARACDALRGGGQSITEIAYQVGFNSPRSFNRVFLRQTGISPREYRIGKDEVLVDKPVCDTL